MCLVNMSPEEMSHDEMIDTLKGLVFGTFDRTTSKERKALDMAIKFLQTESSEDCISRQAVLDKAKYQIVMQETRTGLIEKRGYFVDVDDIKALPPVQPAEVDSLKEFWEMMDDVIDKMEDK